MKRAQHTPKHRYKRERDKKMGEGGSSNNSLVLLLVSFN